MIYPRPQGSFIDFPKMKMEKDVLQEGKTDLISFYNIDVRKYLKLTKKASVIETKNNEFFFIKRRHLIYIIFDNAFVNHRFN